MPSLMISSLKPCISVTIGILFGGGVLIIERSRAPISENCRVRGMGVAVSVSVSTFALRVLSFSFTETPNRCSSSIISRPRSLNLISLPTSLCVPIIISIFPPARSAMILFCSAGFLCRLRYSMLHGNPFNLEVKVL